MLAKDQDCLIKLTDEDRKIYGLVYRSLLVLTA